MSIKNGDSVNSCKDLHTVVWSIEADVADGYVIFLTGDPVSLGCWEPAMGVLLSSSSEGVNVWMTEIKVPCGIQFKYNYFLKEEKQPFKNIVWRPGPEFSLSIPFSKENEVLVVRDSWMRNRMHKLPTPSWGSWMMDVDPSMFQLKEDNHQASSPGEHKMLNSVNGATIGVEKFSVDDTTKTTSSSIKDPPKKSEEDLSERDQPVEEPWLLRSTLVPVVEIDELREPSDQGEVHLVQFPMNLHRVEENLATKDEHEPIHAEDPISTVILINSSVCTMQRIAILEDGKLVELLLEPVKNNVQCDSIYLGVVTKLVPHMGGAFVDIGISRPSLMGIKQNREPFVFPPFNHASKEKTAHGSMTTKTKVLSDADEQSSYDDEDSIDDLLEVDHQDDSLQLIQEDYVEKDMGDDMDVSNAHKMRVNNGALDNGSYDDEEYYEENGDQVEDEYGEDSLSLEAENSNGPDLPQPIQQDLKDSDDIHSTDNKWSHVRKGTKIIVQVVKEGLGTKGPALTAYPNLRSRFWILIARCNRIGVSKKITGAERTRLRVIAKTLQPAGFGLTLRTVAAGHSLEELQKDLDGLLSTWKGIVEHAKSSALAAEEGVEGAVPIMLHRAMGQTLSVVQDYFNEKVDRMVVDSPRTYHEVTRYLEEIAPDLCDRVELFERRSPIFDEYNIEEEINNILSKRVPILNGGSLVIEQTEALVSIDVNGGHGMLGQETSQEEAILEVNLAAAKQIARELRLRDIGGIIVVDFIDMADESNKRLVYEEIKKAVERDRSTVKVSELSKHGLMEITRKRVRPSVTFMISEPCTCCHATGRIEALETSFSKIEHEICRFLAALDKKPDPENAKSWPRFVLRVDRHMCNYLTSGKRTKLAVLSSSLKVWILLKVARGFSRGAFEVKPFSEGNRDNDQKVAISRLRPTGARSYIPNTKLTLFPIKKWKNRGK
ncbi:ribonuclease E/G-like protein, chloroplastic isoform X1 [Asparagus officinalis]|nr:ribonuclease E/G-like protein, chloroplastic isoform X1 [Asparagus officinalis]